MNKSTKKLTTFAISILLAFSMVLCVSAETPIYISVITPDIIYIGDPFDITINVNPNGTEIAGMQLDIYYDAHGIIINSITEGNLFTQNGTYDTFFVDGTYEYGLTKNVYSAILGQYSVSSQGDFITINVTAVSTGNEMINITNVLVSSPEGTYIENIVYNTTMISSEYPPYDLNRDGVVNILDVIIVANHFGDII